MAACKFREMKRKGPVQCDFPRCSMRADSSRMQGGDSNWNEQAASASDLSEKAPSGEDIARKWPPPEDIFI